MPIQTTANDVIFVGHGSYAGGAANFQLPHGVDLWLLQPVGSAMTEGPVTALVANRPIDRLILRQPNGSVNDLHGIVPIIYHGGGQAPNLILHDLSDLLVIVQAATPHGPNHVICVTSDTTIQVLLQRPEIAGLIAAHVALGTALKVFWAACTHSQDNPNNPPTVFHNAKAVAFAAAAYAKANPHNANAIDAADAALDFAKIAANSENTAGAVAAAAAHDAATSTQTTAF